MPIRDSRSTEPDLPFPLLPCLRPDAVVIAPLGQPLRVALSAHRIMTVLDAPEDIASWLASIDGTRNSAQLIDTCPVPAEQARYLLAELDRAGMLIEADLGLPFREAELAARDAQRLASQVRDGFLRRKGLPAPAAVSLRAGQPWHSLLCDAIGASGGALSLTSLGSADILVVVGSPFDRASAEACDRAQIAGTPHVKIEVSAVDVLFGPLTIPGRTACSRCCARHRGNPLDGWRTWAYRGSLPQPPRLANHHQALLSSLAVEHIATLADVLRGTVRADRGDQERHLDLRRATVTVRTVPPHPACGCLTPAAA